jgi:hypothetical protein
VASDRPRSALEFLEREEEHTLEALKGALIAAGDDLCALDELRELVRKHPHLALGAGAVLGALLVPLLGDAARRLLPILVEQWAKRSVVVRGLGALSRHRREV